mmetsp:Transcript_9169/g.15608  ORF Transcript_9169/g.15608 Transcript_9169/m.15608 type:complete len:135 (+) Transcript_9169:62-466(+)
MAKKKGQNKGLVLKAPKAEPKPKAKVKKVHKKEKRKAQAKSKAAGNAPKNASKESPQKDAGSSDEEVSVDDVPEAEVSQYVERVRAFLQKNGKSHIGSIGRKVPKPENLKLGKFLAAHAEIFKIDRTTGSISLN